MPLSGDSVSRTRPAPAPDERSERDRRVLELMPLVKFMAIKMRRSLPAHVELDDLVSAGTLGLLDAVGKFDEGKHVKLGSYARHRIRGAILDGLRTLDTASRDLRKKDRRMERARHELETRLGRAPEDEEMAEALGISLNQWHRTMQELLGAGAEWLRPMQSPVPRQVSEDKLAAENQESQFDLCYRRERREIAGRAMACLSERERAIVHLYHACEMTMREIGTRLRIDESRVSQLHSAAVERLRLAVRASLDRPAAPPVQGAIMPAEYGSPCGRAQA